MSNVLDLVDHTIFSLERAAGTTSLIQCVWVYDRPVEVAGLRRFHNHLQRGRLTRRIELSPLPFGRYRWVTPNAHSQLEIVAIPRPRAQFDAWLAEQANRPLDIEHGSPWHLAVLPFTDGGAGVSLVASHTVADGMGGCLAVAEAASGYDSAIDAPAAGSRRRWQALREDARQTVRDIPAIRRALVAAARSARAARRGRTGAGSPLPARSTGADELITLPTATIFVDADAWTARANALGGTSNSLLAGVAARLAERAGRVTADGSVTLGVPVNARTANDTRANAVTNVDVTVDATRATTDLREIRSATKQALIHRQQVPDERMALLPLVPLLPRRLVRRWVNVYTPSTTSVASSQLGSAPSIVNRPDGTDADYISLLSVCPGLTKATVQLSNGLMALISAEVNGRVFVSVLAYQPDSVTSKEELQQVLSNIMDDFSLPATIGWPSNVPTSN